MKHILALIVSHLVGAGLAYPDGAQFPLNGHDELSLPSTPITPPHSELEWGEINVIHTTDIHGWLLGHQKASEPEPNFSGDYGDFASFVKHMQDIALQKNVDLLLVDSGDVHTGNGLADSTLPGEVAGQDVSSIFYVWESKWESNCDFGYFKANNVLKLLPYDVLTIGNNELYNYSIALDVHTNFATAWNGRFLTSNVDVLVQNAAAKLVSKPIGSKYAKFRTRLGRRVTSLGVLFNFKINANFTIVQNVEDMVKEAWFAEAIRDEPDFFLLVGHMPAANQFWDNNWEIVNKAIRDVHPDTPILIFGGHNHLRNCHQIDSRSMSLGSGKYMETVGWMSVKNLNSDPVFSRRYLDTNLVTYMHHTGTTVGTFARALGRTVKEKVKDIVNKYHLDEVYGIAPQDYRLNRENLSSENNLLNLYIRKAAPLALVNENRKTVRKVVLINNGALRFDVFKGPFTRNDEMSTAAYPDKFRFIKDVPLRVAERLLNTMNTDARRLGLVADRGDMYAASEDEARYSIYWEENNCTRPCASNPGLTPGHVTIDTCPGGDVGAGDDTKHCCYQYIDFPAFASSDLPNIRANPPIDVVFLPYITPKVIAALNKLQSVKIFTTADTEEYSPVQSNQVLGIYARSEWNQR